MRIETQVLLVGVIAIVLLVAIFFYDAYSKVNNDDGSNVVFSTLDIGSGGVTLATT